MILKKFGLPRISPYLIDVGRLDDAHLVVLRRRTPIADFPKIGVGTKPVDGGHYLFEEEEKVAFLAREPNAANLLRPFPCGIEYINNKKRWILHVSGESPSLLRSLPNVMERIRAVRQYRTNEAGKLGQIACGATHRLSCFRCPRESVSRHSRSEFGTPTICSHRLASSAFHS